MYGTNTNTKGAVVVIAGPSGVGKSSIIRRLLDVCPNSRLAVSATTRKMRPGEKDGVNYYFLSEEEFKKAIENGDILEHAVYAGHSYGTYVPGFKKYLDDGHLVIADVDIVGARFLKKAFNATTIFIMPPSKSALLDRLRKRDDIETEEELQARLNTANREMNEDKDFYDFIVVNENNKLDKAVEEVLNILKNNNLSCVL